LLLKKNAKAKRLKKKKLMPLKQKKKPLKKQKKLPLKLHLKRLLLKMLKKHQQAAVKRLKKKSKSKSFFTIKFKKPAFMVGFFHAPITKTQTIPVIHSGHFSFSRTLPPRTLRCLL